MSAQTYCYCYGHYCRHYYDVCYYYYYHHHCHRCYCYLRALLSAHEPPPRREAVLPSGRGRATKCAGQPCVAIAALIWRERIRWDVWDA